MAQHVSGYATPPPVFVPSTLRKKEPRPSNYKGSWKDLTALVQAHSDGLKPSKYNADAFVLNLTDPKQTQAFQTRYVPLKEGMPVTTQVSSRYPGELPYARVYATKTPEALHALPETHSVDIALYPHTLLEPEYDERLDPGLYVVSVKAKGEEPIPMNPMTMARNTLAKDPDDPRGVGGTYPQQPYTEQQWADAVYYHCHPCAYSNRTL